MDKQIIEVTGKHLFCTKFLNCIQSMFNLSLDISFVNLYS